MTWGTPSSLYFMNVWPKKQVPWRGTQLGPTGMTAVCWKTTPPINQNILMSVSEKILLESVWSSTNKMCSFLVQGICIYVDHSFAWNKDELIVLIYLLCYMQRGDNSNIWLNNISVISWRSVLLVEETRVPGENHRPVASHWQTLSHNVVSNTPRLGGIRMVKNVQKKCHRLLFIWLMW